MNPVSVGILSVGRAMPETVRQNADWPQSFLLEFDERARRDITLPDLGSPTANALAREVIGRYRKDPFAGTVERRIARKDQSAATFEVMAARDALERARVLPHDIDLLLVCSAVPDLLCSSQAALLHHELGLKQGIMTINVDTQCSGFLAQCRLAAAQIQAGSAKRALLVQSALYSRIMPYERPLSVNFGDAATAAVVGQVPDGSGFLGSSWFTDGTFFKGVCLAPQNGAAWYSGSGPLVAHTLDVEKMKLQAPLFGVLSREAVETALDLAHEHKKDVKFFSVHQPTAWFGELCQRTAGLEHATMEYSFQRFGGCGPTNVLLNLFEGVEKKSLRNGDLVAMYSCGAGMTWGATVMRWSDVA